MLNIIYIYNTYNIIYNNYYKVIFQHSTYLFISPFSITVTPSVSHGN